MQFVLLFFPDLLFRFFPIANSLPEGLYCVVVRRGMVRHDASTTVCAGDDSNENVLR